MLQIKKLTLMLTALVMLVLVGCSSKKSVTATATAGRYPGVPKQEVILEPSLKGIRRNLVKEAMTWIGTPYQYGGHSRKGTDCSGFVMEVYGSAAGKKLPRSSREQESLCKRIKRQQLEAGDLVFFGGTKGGGRVAHVGMYIGGNKMIHASTSRGVMVSRIDDPYFGPRFFSAGKVPGIKEGKREDPVPTPTKVINVQKKVPEITLDQLDLILQQKVDSISNSLLFD
ncbi:MAG: C40 family peptidase [Muribaculaceae bacterium]|nr:C40 family peptidase [Muribaculaceae bacterium]